MSSAVHEVAGAMTRATRSLEYWALRVRLMSTIYTFSHYWVTKHGQFRPYTNFAPFNIEDQKGVTVLRSCTSYSARMDRLPSWSPDWKTTQFESPLFGHGYRSARVSQHSLEYNPGRNEFRLLGIVINHSTITSPLAHGYFDPDTDTSPEVADNTSESLQICINSAVV